MEVGLGKTAKPFHDVHAHCLSRTRTLSLTHTHTHSHSLTHIRMNTPIVPLREFKCGHHLEQSLLNSTTNINIILLFQMINTTAQIYTMSQSNIFTHQIIACNSEYKLFHFYCQCPFPYICTLFLLSAFYIRLRIYRSTVYVPVKRSSH